MRTDTSVFSRAERPEREVRGRVRAGDPVVVRGIHGSLLVMRFILIILLYYSLFVHCL